MRDALGWCSWLQFLWRSARCSASLASLIAHQADGRLEVEHHHIVKIDQTPVTVQNSSTESRDVRKKGLLEMTQYRTRPKYVSI